MAFPSSGDLLDPGIEPESPALAGGFFTTEPPGKQHEFHAKGEPRERADDHRRADQRVPVSSSSRESGGLMGCPEVGWHMAPLGTEITL